MALSISLPMQSSRTAIPEVKCDVKHATAKTSMETPQTEISETSWHEWRTATDNPDILAAAQDVSAELSEVIVSNFTNGGWVSDATGMSIYLPVNGPDDIYYEGSWNDLTAWTEMLEAVDN